MSEKEAKAKAIERWRELPEPERRTRDQAAVFAQKLAMEGLTYDGCPHPYHYIKSWLQRDLKEF